MKKQARLHRVLGLFETTLSGIGIIFGAGIYVLVGKAAGIAGVNVWLSFLLAAIVAALTGLSYAELSSMYPKASAEYEYSKNAFGKRAGFLVGWLALIAVLFTLVESAGLVVIVFIGLPYIGKMNLLDFSNFNFTAVFEAPAFIFFAFIGFEEIVRMSEETKNPKKIIPTALIIAIIVSSVVYVLVALSSVAVLGVQKLSESSAPLAEVAFSVF